MLGQRTRVLDRHLEAGELVVGETVELAYVDQSRDALDPENGLHRIDVELVKREVLAAGFLLQAESELLRHPEEVSADPACWMPWNYRAMLDGLAATASAETTA